MFTVEKEFELACSHQLLHLPYESKCQNIHGHNYKVKVTCKAVQLNEQSMVVDFYDIKRVLEKFDHVHLNDILEIPTTENFAMFLLKQIPNCTKIEINESEKNKVTYEIINL